MSYQIIYGEDKRNCSYYQKSKKKRRVNIAAILIVLALIFILSGRILTKEERVVANAAMDNFAENIAEGEGLGDAVTAFCRDIIKSANDVE